MRRKVWVHRSLAAFWVLLAIPGALWWSESIMFVILASLYANAAASWSSAEASDDRSVCDRLDRMQHQLDELLEQQRHPRN